MTEIELLKEIVNVQDKYIEFLSNALSKNAVFMYSHGLRHKKEEIEKGEKFRKTIKELKIQL